MIMFRVEQAVKNYDYRVQVVGAALRVCDLFSQHILFHHLSLLLPKSTLKSKTSITLTRTRTPAHLFDLINSAKRILANLIRSFLAG
jgi:hypothetical protein